MGSFVGRSATEEYICIRNKYICDVSGGEAGMRHPFESAYFKKTKLYLDIKTWSQGKLKREILFC